MPPLAPTLVPPPPAPPSPVVARQMERWRERLIDLSRRNPLIALRLLRPWYTLLSRPDPATVFDRLARAGEPFRFWLPPDANGNGNGRRRDRIRAEADELVCEDLERRELTAILTGLFRKARSDFQERGLHTLHVVFGSLEWREPGGQVMQSPLLLLPVELSRPSLRDPFSLSPVGEEPILNPALQSRLQRDFHFRLPEFGEREEEWPTLPAWFDAVQSAVGGMEGWRLDRDAMLTVLSFDKGVMHQDLAANEEAVCSHPLVRALAGDAGVSVPVAPVEPEPEDGHDPREDFPILDADSSQKTCLRAAARGESFVLIGPPGTGKSQTIANLVADRLARGQTVLFVSEKMAALEVVFRRLQQAGLGDYCLELHSHLAHRPRVVGELYRCLYERPRPDAEPTDADFAALRDRRDRLNAYVRALHARRPGLEMSVADAVAEVVRRDGVDLWPLDHTDPAACDRAWLEEATRAVQAVARLRKVLDEGPDFPWHGFRAEAWSLRLREETADWLDGGIRAVVRLRTLIAEAAARVGGDGPPEWLTEASALLERSPRPPRHWFTDADFDGLGRDLARYADTQRCLKQTRRTLGERYGPAVWQLPAGTAAGLEQAWRDAAALLAGDDRGERLLFRRHDAAAWCDGLRKQAASWRADAAELAAWLGLSPLASCGRGVGGEGNEEWSPRRLRHLVDLLRIVPVSTAPPASWLSPAGVKAAREAISALRDGMADVQASRADLLTRYDERFLSLELDRLAARFGSSYVSAGRFWNPGYYSDRESVRRVSRDGTLPPTLTADLRLARDLLRRQERLLPDLERHRASLGRYFRGLDTPLEAATKAADTASEAVRLAGWLGIDRVPDILARLIDDGLPLPPHIEAVRDRLTASLDAWHAQTSELAGLLPTDALPGTTIPLADATLSTLLAYSGKLREALNRLEEAADPVLALAMRRPADFSSLVDDLRQGELLRVWAATEDGESERRRGRFGPAYQGPERTDFAALRASWEWVRDARALFPAGNVPSAFVECACGGKVAGPGGAALADARAAVDRMRAEIGDKFGGVAVGGPLPALESRLRTLRARLDELSDWVDWQALPGRFGRLGLSAFWDRLRERSADADTLPEVFQKAFFADWAEAVSSADVALATFRGPEHDQLADEFRQLDRRLVAEGSRRVARRAEEGRPKALHPVPGSEVEQLQRQALIKARHRPLRRLFNDVPTLLQQLKPCLLMSPLSVSQFLACDRLRFDLVVFDEASQIAPEDAVGAIFRGRQVIVAGDDQQLPPTDFFQPHAEEDEESAVGGSQADGEPRREAAAYASILDHCRNVLPTYQLRWHYRSRSEGLIAFSNRQFYAERLQTFPAAHASHPALGVVFRHVEDGVYDRGGRRDNRREAEVVADMLFEQLRRFPHRTAGVIAFSQAQMSAIEDQIEARRRAEPEFDAFFSDDRLESVFVRNLETVQGDERDVIFLSVGYGRDSHGRPSLNFGALNRPGGERRLNVAVTRAREKLVVVSSLRAVDLDGRPTQSAGVLCLRRYLDYAERGPEALGPRTALAHVAGPTAVAEDVASVIRSWGYTVDVGVGTAGTVDLAIADPSTPGRYILGVLCDGPTYRAAATACDRDRLRPQVLEMLGWRLARVWSPDWFRQRERTAERLRLLVEEAKRVPVPPAVPKASKKALRAALANGNGHADAATPLPEPSAEILPGAVPYRVFVPEVPAEWRGRDFLDVEARPTQARMLEWLVENEGPLHQDAAMRRVLKAWGCERVSDKLRAAFAEVLAKTVEAEQVRSDGEFLWSAVPAEVVPRVPVDGVDLSQRGLAQIAPAERQSAMTLLARLGIGIDSESLLRQTARAFGFRYNDTTRPALQADLDALLERGELVWRGERLGVPLRARQKV